MKKIFTCLILFCLSWAAPGAFAQQAIRGKVTSVGGEPLPGASVLIKGTTVGTVTDVDGNYTLTVPGEARTLVFSFIGYKTAEVEIAARTIIDFQMEPDVTQLSEIVVTAFGLRQEKKALATAVQEVSGEEIIQARETNLVNSIGSKVAGVQVIRQGGSAGAASSIIIRGNASVGRNNQPLFVVDGVPINNSFRSSQGDNTSNGTGTGVDNANRAIDINPDDIESMTVLKGPSATALYGLQAGNGVIVITTKRGSRAGAKQMRVNYSTSYSIDDILNYFPKQGIYAQGDGGVFSGGTTFSHFGPPISTLRFDGSSDNPKNANGFIVDMNDPSAIADARVPVYDNQKDFYQTGRTWNNHLSVSSGTEKGSYYFSIGHLDQEGIIPNDAFSRTTVKITGESSLSDKIKVTGSATYVQSKSTKFGRGDNFSDVIQGTLRVPRTFQNSAGFEFPNGEQRNWRYIPGQPFGFGPDNPFWTVNKNPYNDEVNRIIGFLQGNYKVLPWLDIMYRLGTDVATDKRNQVWATGSKGGDSRASSGVTGRLIEDTYTDRILNSDLFITANKQFGEDWTTSLMLGHNYFTLNTTRQFISGRNFAIPGLVNINNTQEDIIPLDDETRKRTTAAFARMNIGWKGMLFLEQTGRNEWSSALPVENNSFFYGATSLAFVFSEVLDIDESILTFGKLKGSFAQVGNDAPVYATETFFENNPVSSDFARGVVFPVDGVGGAQRSNTAGNDALEPEENSTIELGADLRFWNNRIGLDFTWYQSVSTNQIISVAVPGSTGFTNQRINSGEIENTGIEMVLSATPVRINDFSWDVMFNFTRNRNIVNELPLESIISPQFSSRLQSAMIPGEPFNVFYGNAFKRNEQGQLLISPTGFPQLAAEQKIIGDPNPDWLGGWRNTFRYKDFSFSFLWDIRMGGDVANVTGHWMDAQGVADHSENRNQLVVFRGVVDNPGESDDGQPNTKQVLLDQNFYSSTAGNRNIAERWIEDGSWWRLRDVTLTYSLPNTLISKIGLESLDLSIYGRNLILITEYSGIDPETNLVGIGAPRNASSPNPPQGIDAFTTPNTRSYGVTLNVSF